MFLLIYYSFFGTNIGVANPAILLIWIGWWILIVFLFLPINARSWCAICPIPMVGTYYHRYKNKENKKKRHFSKKYSLYGGIPLILFTLFSSLSIPISTIPLFTGFVLLVLLVLSSVIDVIFGKRTFCKSICPINPLLGVYNRSNVTKIEPIDYQICLTSHPKTCILGNNQGMYGCEWGFFAGKLKENQCTTCLDCFKSCTYDNLSLTFSKTNVIPKFEEKMSWINSFAPIYFLGIIFVYIISKIGALNPFHQLMLVDNIGSWLVYLSLEISIIFILIPLIFVIFMFLPMYLIYKKEGKQLNETIPLLKRITFTSIPLSLSAWISFTLILIVPNLSLLFQWLTNTLNLGNLLNYFTSTENYFNLIYIFGLNLAQMVLILGFFTTIYLVAKNNNELQLVGRKKIFISVSQYSFYLIFFLTFNYSFNF
ncbi:MAG: hypothetical protein HeimC3_41670 [Candidatus Heimdallarchaeota archaeon LC_3]|nr:MAG: hypothetical protein HeimC3_41670 [Candidatus Heimdallarchaeota archaeon LC_3]